MDIWLTAAVVSRARDGDAHRYDGTVMLSALPSAPVVPERRRWFRSSAHEAAEGVDPPYACSSSGQYRETKEGT